MPPGALDGQWAAHRDGTVLVTGNHLRDVLDDLDDIYGGPAEWLSGSQEQTLAGSLAAFVGHTACNAGTLRADLHRFAFLLGASDGDDLFGEPTP